MTGYANWQSGEVENLVPVGSTPTSVTNDPVVQRRRRLGDNQESDGSIPSGITDFNWSVSAEAARRFGMAEDWVQFPDGPLTDNGRLVQREDASFAPRRSGFDSPAGPLN